MLAVSYMGTKRHLATSVAELAADCKAGALLDVFSGMCAVGQAVAPSRQIWSNDLQAFAVLVARCQFCHTEALPTANLAKQDLSRHYGRHLNTLLFENRHEIDAEQRAIDGKCVGTLSKQFEDKIFIANRLNRSSGSGHRLFLQRYAGTYLGWQQCAEIDSLRYAIDQIADQARKDWFLVALSGAMAKCGNTTGHFAQALYPKSSNIGTVVGQRRRSIWTEFLYALDRLEVIGSIDWRTKNRVFQSDASALLAALQGSEEVGVVYADPPYTSDQYSRYYHLYETLILYDYPSARGRGLYRDDRAVSTYSHATKVRPTMERLIANTARMGADLILSYPSNGLLPNSRAQISAMITEHFGKPPEIIPLMHSHSTMGASKGSARHQVTELLYKATS